MSRLFDVLGYFSDECIYVKECDTGTTPFGENPQGTRHYFPNEDGRCTNYLNSLDKKVCPITSDGECLMKCGGKKCAKFGEFWTVENEDELIKWRKRKNTNLRFFPVKTKLKLTTRASVNRRICNEPNDLAIVLDCSYSVNKLNKNNYYHAKEFVASLAIEFLQHPGNRFALIHYATEAKLQISLDNSLSLEDINSTILATEYMAKKTATGSAINLTTGDLMKNKLKNRSQTMVVLTDGNRNIGMGVVDAVTISKNEGIEMIAVGIGSSVSAAELQTIAGSKVFTLGEYDKLNKILKPLHNEICEPIPDKPGPEDHVPCEIEQDVLLLLDSSESVVETFYNKLKEAVGMFSEWILQQKGSRISIAYFSNETVIAVPFKNSLNVAQLKEKINMLPLLGETTRLGAAFRSATGEISNNKRANVTSSLVVITDGMSMDNLTAKILKSGIGISKFAIGIAPDYRMSALKAIAGPNVSVTSLESNRTNWDTVEESMNKIYEKICPNPNVFITCKTETDLMFLLDSSGSIESNRFESIKAFASGLALAILLRNGSRVGLINFSKEGIVHVPRSELSELQKDEVVKQIKSTLFLNSGTEFKDGFLKGTNELTKHTRVNVTQNLIIFTDGMSDDNAFEAAAAATEGGISNRLAVGVGRDLNVPVLQILAGNDNNVFQVPAAEELPNFANIISTRLCSMATSKKVQQKD